MLFLAVAPDVAVYVAPLFVERKGAVVNPHEIIRFVSVEEYATLPPTAGVVSPELLNDTPLFREKLMLGTAVFGS